MGGKKEKENALTQLCFLKRQYMYMTAQQGSLQKVFV